ncbi:MAG: ribonuclease R [Muribaculaceae bacterium]|nr:ribonuclease R [Muribaculaceae bacterium]
MAKNKNNGRLTKDIIRDRILNFFDRENGIPYNYKHVSSAIGINTPVDFPMVAKILEELAASGILTETTPGKFKSPKKKQNVATGIFCRRNNGKNSVILDVSENKDGIFVAERNSMHALNGDKVEVHISAKRWGYEPEAIVTRIIERKNQIFVGTLRIDRYFAHIITDSKFLASDIVIPIDMIHGAKSGDKVTARIIEWHEDTNTPIGEIVDILGTTGDNNAEIHAILAEYGLPYRYPEAVEKAAEKIDARITPEIIAQRKDFRDITTFTIDPKDAKDFDDALSVRKLNNGNWEVGVHIADVTHYVLPGSIIDIEARQRATSIYLVDRTIPMLPERLCNDICSLRPNEEKLAYSCILEMDEDANVIKYDICHTVIKSDRRFTYEEAQKVIETGEGDFKEEIITLDRLAKLLRQARYENGSVDFDRTEVRFEIDETGRPVDVYFKRSQDANKLIEEFMLLANKKVAEFIGKPEGRKKPKPFVYRVHDKPDQDKMGNLHEIAGRFGYKLKITDKATETNRSLNNMLKQIKNRPEENLLSMLAIRSMAKAVYTTVNIGHYGLAFDFYTHFTSPIRRYPDMMVHRLLDRYIAGKRAFNAEKLEDECEHSSSMEQLASNAERASIKYKQVEYLGERLGNVYDGIISGVTEWGFYVELDDNKCEGLVPIRDLEGDYYEFDEKNYCLIGRNSRHRYQLGDKVTIQIARADLTKKQLDFVLVDEKNPVGTHRIDKVPITESRSKLLQIQEKKQTSRQKSREIMDNRRSKSKKKDKKKKEKSKEKSKKRK